MSFEAHASEGSISRMLADPKQHTCSNVIAEAKNLYRCTQCRQC